MASSNEEGINSGRRTRSGKISTPQPISPARLTRRSSKKVSETVAFLQDEQNEKNRKELEQDIISQQSDIIKEMLVEAAQGVIVTEECEVGSGDVGDSCVIEVRDANVEDLVEELHKDDYDDCIVYEEEAIEQQGDDVEMYTIQEEPEQVIETLAHSSTAAIDEKSSSFPFGTVIQSETSDDVQNEEENEEENSDVATGGMVENSLLASLAGDNANSLPSVGGGEEGDIKKDDFEGRSEERKDAVLEKMDSDDSLSEPAVAEDIFDGNCIDASNATIVNTEMVSEDELPMPTKPEINDAEEVSDDELPAPQRAELPPDAEVISEDELPANATTDKKSPSASPTSNVNTTNKQKRKVDSIENELNSAGSNNEKYQKQNEDFVQISKSEQYNPMSPTSESNDGTPPLEKKVKIDEEENSNESKEKKKEVKDKDKEKEKEKKRLPDLDKYWRSVKEDPTDFTGWTYLLQYVDNESDAEAAREAYDAFLAHYPYCYGYWRKYADYEKRKGIKANCNTVFERGLKAIPLSVDLWIHYLSHVKSNTNNSDEDYIRAQFESAVEACGLEFRSDKLWDAYLKWENDNKRYHRVVQIYDRLLAIPTQGYSGHFDNFQDLVNQHSLVTTINPEELLRLRMEVRESLLARSSKSKERPVTSSSKDKDHKESPKTGEKDHKEYSKDSDKEYKETKSNDKEKDVKDSRDSDSNDKKPAKQESKDQIPVLSDASKEIRQSSGSTEATSKDMKQSPVKEFNLNDLTTLTDQEISLIRDKVISIRRKIHKNTVAAVTARWTFEEGIKRPYFHVKPLERCQLKNWKDYLDFEIEKGDRKRILVLFERCLIACALYEEFWLKMIRYLETVMNEPGVPQLTSDVYRRACQIHHPDKPSLHLMWSAFEECQNNFDRAAHVLVDLEEKCPNILQVAYRRINLERRRGDIKKCKELYDHYISTAKNKTIAGSLTIKYARFLNKICHDIDAGIRVLRQTLEKDPGNTRVALQMIDLTLQRDKVDEDEVVLIMDKFMARENIDPEQKVLFAQRKVEFLEDFGSTARGLQEAQRGLQLALTKANEAKKKRESSPSRKSSVSGKDGMPGTSVGQMTAYNNGASAVSTNYNYNSANSVYYGQQNSGAYQQSYDGYYNQWQYGSSSGYGGYNQWSGYGNYY